MTAPVDPTVPVDDQPVPPSTEPAPTDPPPPVDPPTEPIQYQPNMYYSGTWTCTTAGCPNQNQTLPVDILYSNDGNPAHIGVFCGRCNKPGLILTATLLDPQPPEE
jgi:hypothetical protein